MSALVLVLALVFGVVLGSALVLVLALVFAVVFGVVLVSALVLGVVLGSAPVFGVVLVSALVSGCGVGSGVGSGVGFAVPSVASGFASLEMMLPPSCFALPVTGLLFPNAPLFPC